MKSYSSRTLTPNDKDVYDIQAKSVVHMSDMAQSEAVS